MMIDEQLAELLEQLGVVLETEATPPAGPVSARPQTPASGVDLAAESSERVSLPDEIAANLMAISELSLFQTSREHYGVFYRLDLAGDVPQLRVFMPDDEDMMRMRCYFVQAAAGTPPRQWFQATTIATDASPWSDGHDATRQHLLFAAGEVLKRQFWTGDLEAMRFTDGIDVVRLA